MTAKKDSQDKLPALNIGVPKLGNKHPKHHSPKKVHTQKKPEAKPVHHSAPKKVEHKHHEHKPHHASHPSVSHKHIIAHRAHHPSGHHEMNQVKQAIHKAQAQAHAHASQKPRAIKAQAPNLMNEKEIAMDFATKVHRKFDSLIKGTILFGSQAKNTAKSTSDIDMVIIIDDAAINWDLELIAWYREELAKLVSLNDYQRELHINTIKLTTWWNDLMHGDPVVINILRYGEPLIDIGGFFNPLKSLLIQGKIHSTPEAVYAALQRAPAHLARSRISQMSAVEGVYWTMVDSAQAALITIGKLPPSPEHIADMLKESFVDTGLIKADYVRWFREIYTLHKGIAHGDVRTVKGIEIDQWQSKAEDFMRRLTELIDKILETRKG